MAFRLHPWVATIVCALVGLATAAADPTPPEQLAEARAAFRRAACAEAAPRLSDILYPTPRLARTNDLIEAHLLLGACRLQAGDVAAARREFEEALFLDRGTDIDPLVYAAETVAFFRETKRALVEREQREGEKRELAAEKERLRKFRESLVFVERRSYVVNFVPLGAGQFQNKQRTKAMISFVGQAATGGASIAVWGYLVGTYGYKGAVPPEDARTVRSLQQAGIALGATFYALYAWSVVDAMVNYQPRVQIQADESLMQDTLPPAAARAASGGKRGPRLLPLVDLEQGRGLATGLGLVWER